MCHTADGKCSSITGLQLPGILDELFSYNGPLGAVYSSEAISLFLWAPTAQVCLLLRFYFTIYVYLLLLFVSTLSLLRLSLLPPFTSPLEQAVRACIYKDSSGGSPLEIVQLEENNGVWSAKGPTSWDGCYYVYEVSVYHPSTLQIVKCHANDPYARGYAGCLL